ncbi:uncharacterized protein [Apostichopus japonicus]|uniref:uncharacterized protein isoform X2 n=1 Tax=Stichopus japonicus TaxID=307972 RepID=UPI003AB4F088
MTGKSKEREALRQEKKQRDEELVKKGKESIAKGLKSQAESEKKKTSSLKSTDDALGNDGINKRVLMAERGRRLSAIPSREDGEESSLSESVMSAGGDAKYSNGSQEERPIEERIQGWEQLPPHKQELYRLFGPEEAECILHPKIMPEKKRVIQVPTALRNQGGRAGADPLWHLLRSKTHLKLEQADSQIPAELKQAYSAYIREYLTHTKPASRRQFYTERDLPPSERMEDSRYHEHIREIRHRMELMYRSSLANEDKTSVLLHNNPMPDFNDLNGSDGIERYHPSWVDGEVEDSRSEDEQVYRKWLPPLETSKSPEEPEPQPRSKSSNELQRMDPQKKGNRGHRSYRGQKLSFLTEEKATSEGQFWRNRRNPEIPEPSVPGYMIMTEALDDNVDYHVPEMSQDEGQENVLRLRQSRSQNSTMRESKSSASYRKWQPLTLSALRDHRPTVDLPGTTDFRFGQPMTWKPIVANNSSSTT